MRSPVVDALRRETATSHRRLDADFAAQDRLADRATYARYLRAVASVHLAVELAVERSIGHAATATGFSPKAHLIDADLERLGFDPLPPPATEPVPLENDDAVLGALYVIEGSTLGGRTIARLVEQRFTGSAATATAFLDPYGTDTLSRWRRTTRAIDDRVRDLGAATRHARTVFERFELALSELDLSA